MTKKVIESDTAKKTAISCFNKAWDYIDKKKRTEDDIIEMLNLVHSSLWLWQNVDGHTKTNLSVGYWQVSRVYALVGDGLNSKRFALKCVEISKDKSVEPFFLAYGYEAAARALKISGNPKVAKEYISKAKEALSHSKEKDTEGLQKDLEEIESNL